jgi:hypothetical protein
LTKAHFFLCATIIDLMSPNTLKYSLYNNLISKSLYFASYFKSS